MMHHQTDEDIRKQIEREQRRLGVPYRYPTPADIELQRYINTLLRSC